MTGVRPLPPAPSAVDERRLERCAKDMASMSATVAEQLIETNVRLAVTEWRLADATFWQRVRYRARQLRAAARVKPAVAARPLLAGFE